ncbi:fungal Rad9-like Rad53-binding-domain-containing protein [Scheffersomyces amazonensis]|uniref:fungal Rad9-like Rad53-binding-domain-containing protein n=1 Tax=Scheffersomyces amazonensis TaxID=1078765 RepID=UPI00315D880E
MPPQPQPEPQPQPQPQPQSSTEIDTRTILNSNVLDNNEEIPPIPTLMADTQIIPKLIKRQNTDIPIRSHTFHGSDLPDTQIIDRSKSMKEPIIFSSDETQLQLPKDINKDIKELNSETQVEIDTTTQNESTILDDNNTNNISNINNINNTTEITTKLIQVPSTIERNMSHRQVLNTQESSGIYLHDTDASIDEEEVIDIEVHSDIDKEEGESINFLDNPYEDSLFTNKLKRRKLIKSSSDTSTGTSIPRVSLAALTSKSVSSDSGNIISSPLINRITGSTKKTNDVTDQPTRITDSFEYLSSEIEDIDIEDPQLNGSTNEPIQSHSVTTKRRKNFVVNTQSQTNATIELDEQPNEILRIEKSVILSDKDFKVKTSLWALYNLKMYPGSLIKTGNEVSQIEFYEGIYDIKNSDLFLLDIRIGDTIRINTSRNQFKVTGLTYDESIKSISCIRGYNVVYVQKVTRNPDPGPEISISISECYMEVSDWMYHQQNFSLILEQKNVLKDPIDKSIITKSFEDFRTKSSPIAISSTRSSPKKNSILFESDKLFSRMLFCLTNIEGERKDELYRLIENNGGTILNDGFNEFISYSENNNINNNGNDLQLISNGLQKYSFAAMISNGFCRSAKYLQTLALGWPIISETYILDCINDKSKVIQWPVYLLPAGQSSYMNSIKSLDIFNFRVNWERDLLLNEQLRNNCHLFQDANIIVFNKKAHETLDLSKFIFYSFGASSLHYCDRQVDVMNNIRELSYKDKANIYVYDDSSLIQTKLAGLQKTTNSGNGGSKRDGPKRKLSQRLRNSQLGRIDVKVINWEWLVQCVISSYIWDTTTFIISI